MTMPLASTSTSHALSITRDIEKAGLSAAVQRRLVQLATLTTIKAIQPVPEHNPIVIAERPPGALFPVVTGDLGDTLGSRFVGPSVWRRTITEQTPIVPGWNFIKIPAF